MSDQEKDRSINIDSQATVQKIEVSPDFLKISCPCRLLISGPTMSGKSFIIEKLVKYRELIFNVHFDAIYYCIPGNSMEHHYDYIETLKHACRDIHIIEGLPSLEANNLLDPSFHKLVIIDDLGNLCHYFYNILFF